MALAAVATGCVSPPPPRPPDDYVTRWARGTLRPDEKFTSEVCSFGPYSECERRALAGNTEAARFMWLMPVPSGYADDPVTRFRWMMHAAKIGDAVALDLILVEFAPEGKFPNDAKLMEFIELGVELGRSPALVAKAAYLQDTDPQKSRALYERAAKADNCLAQAMLAASYLEGIFSEINEAKAYFWWVISQRPRSTEKANPVRSPFIATRLKDRFKIMALGRQNYGCPSEQIGLSALKSAPFAQEVQDLLLAWVPGQDAPEQLQRFKDQRAPSLTAMEAAPLPRSASAVPPVPDWQPLALSMSVKTSTREVSREDLYDRLSRSVYVVLAAPSKKAMRLRENVAQGSAVAVETNAVLTNCHIIKNRPEVVVVVAGEPRRATVAAARMDSDACVLRVADPVLSPIVAVKSAKSLRVGEEVLAIGSPSGFTNSLSTGVVSQLRTDGTATYVQTTAQISPGSSGGGLFDRYGNLVGITTFKVGDAEGLGFAVAIEEFVQLPPR